MITVCWNLLLHLWAFFPLENFYNFTLWPSAFFAAVIHTDTRDCLGNLMSKLFFAQTNTLWQHTVLAGGTHSDTFFWKKNMVASLQVFHTDSGDWYPRTFYNTLDPWTFSWYCTALWGGCSGVTFPWFVTPSMRFTYCQLASSANTVYDHCLLESAAAFMSFFPPRKLL